MSAIFEMSIDSEWLSQDELRAIAGHSKKDQVTWLDKNGWIYTVSRNGQPVVGRLYARLKMAGINPNALTSSGGWSPDFSALNS